MVLHLDRIGKTEKHPCIDKLGVLVNKKYNPWIDAILEVTYGYQSIWNGKRYNTSLFKEYCWIERTSEWRLMRTEWQQEALEHHMMPWFSASIELDYCELKEVFITKAQWDITKFENLAQEIRDTDNNELLEYWIGESEKKVLLETIEHNVCLLKLAINGIDFELEKTWYDHGLDDNEINEKIAENERLEKIVFWGNILESKKESEFAFEYLMKWFKEHFAKSQEEQQKRVDDKLASRVLDKTEKARLEWYIKEIWEAVSWKGYSIEAKKVKEHNNLTRDFFKKFSHVRIPREVFKNFFQWTIDLQWMRQTVEVTQKGSIYDGPTKLEIPDSESFETLDFERVCWLLVHEISWHYINQANHEAGAYGNVRLSWNIEKEEWLAMLSEKLVKWLPVSWADVMNPSFIMVLASEIFSGEKLKDFIDLYMDISERKSSSDANLARRKRNYPDDYVWVQHKDVAYVRGLIRVTDYLDVDSEDSWWNIEDLFVWKVGIQSILDGDFSFDEDKMLFPILNVEVMLFYIMNALWENKRVRHKDFVAYMKEKYKWVVSEASMKKLEKTKLWPKHFREMLWTISPIMQEFKNQAPANDNAVPEIVSETCDRIADIVWKAA